MQPEAVLSGLRRLFGWLCPCRRELRAIIKGQGGIEVKLSEYLQQIDDLSELLRLMNGQLSKVQAEILAILQGLDARIAELQGMLSDPNVPAEAVDKLAAIKTVADEVRGKVQAMDEWNPDTPPEPSPEPPPVS